MQAVHISSWDRNAVGFKPANRLSINLDKAQEDVFDAPQCLWHPFPAALLYQSSCHL